MYFGQRSYWLIAGFVCALDAVQAARPGLCEDFSRATGARQEVLTAPHGHLEQLQCLARQQRSLVKRMHFLNMKKTKDTAI
jgi:hypothetical protein